VRWGHNADMRRLLLLVPLLVVVAIAVVAVTRGSDEGPVARAGLTADVVPYPRTTSPLPVPEVRIAEEPWRDELEGVAPEVAPSPLPPTSVPPCQVPRFREKVNGSPSTPLPWHLD
jgi:hypothetical protein